MNVNPVSLDLAPKFNTTHKKIALTLKQSRVRAI